MISAILFARPKTSKTTSILKWNETNKVKKEHYLMRQREREMFYLTTHSTHFIYGYMASDIWLRTILIVRKEARCCHIGYSYRLTARVLLYAPSHRQDNTYHSLCRTSWNEKLYLMRQDKTIYSIVHCLVSLNSVLFICLFQYYLHKRV